MLSHTNKYAYEQRSSSNGHYRFFILIIGTFYDASIWHRILNRPIMYYAFTSLVIHGQNTSQNKQIAVHNVINSETINNTSTITNNNHCAYSKLI